MRKPLLSLTLIATLGAVGLGQLVADPAGARPASAADPRDRGADDLSLIRELEAMASMHPDDAAIALKLAFAFIEIGDGGAARRWIDKAEAIDPFLTGDVLNSLANGGGEGEGNGGGVAGGGDYPKQGPDIIVGDIHQLKTWGRVGNITAYSVGTNSCNAGDTTVEWVNNTNQHPVIAQHMYRYKDGRFEMIGQSWVKHGFFALANSLCQPEFGYSCQNPGTSTKLGVGCSDPYSANLNGNYTYLGPKHEINPTTGSFPYPFGSFPNNSPIGKRLQVHDDDLKPSLNEGAAYYVEGHYITPDDAAAGNDLNNASHRRVAVVEATVNEFNLSFMPGHPTMREFPAIYAWQGHDPEVVIQEIDVPGDGRYIVAYRVKDNGDGTWNYEYAVHNFNSDRAAGSFSLEVAPGVNVTNIGFRSVPWHSGAPYSNTPWSAAHQDGALEWTTQTHASNPNANALRWGTLYNFRFDADAPPMAGEGTFGLFKPGGPGSPAAIPFAAAVPQTPTPSIPGDLNGDGSVGVEDLLILLGQWGACSDCDDCAADLDGDCNVGVSDLLLLLANWG